MNIKKKDNSNRSLFFFDVDCFEYDKDSPGNDVGFRWNPSSLEACQRMCQEESRCNVFQFKRNAFWIYNGCWLKSKKSSNLRSSSGMIMGPKYCSKCSLDMINYLERFNY